MYQRAYPQSWKECLTTFIEDTAPTAIGDPPIYENWGPATGPTVRVTPTNNQFPFCPFLVVAHGVPLLIFYPEGSLQYAGPPTNNPDGFTFFRDWANSIAGIRSRLLPGNIFTRVLNDRLNLTPISGPPVWKLPGVVFVGGLASLDLPEHPRIRNALLSSLETINIRVPLSPVYTLAGVPVLGAYLKYDLSGYVLEGAPAQPSPEYLETLFGPDMPRVLTRNRYQKLRLSPNLASEFHYIVSNDGEEPA